MSSDPRIANRHWLTLVLLPWLVAPACADFALFEDFDDLSLGPVHGQDGWIAFGGENRVALDPAGGANQVLFVPSSSSIIRRSLSLAGLSIPDATTRMFFMRMRIAERQTFSVGVSPFSSPSEYSDFAPELGMASNAPNLDLRVWDDDGDNYQVLTQLAANAWYNVWVRIDTQANEYEVWLHARPGDDATPADQLDAPDGDLTFGFRSGDGADLITFYIKTSGGGSGFGPAYFDDIHLEQTPEPNLDNPTNPPIILCAGDLDCSGTIDFFDIDPLVLALQGEPAYLAIYPGCYWLNGDIDGDGDVDFFDIDPFVNLLGTVCP